MPRTLHVVAGKLWNSNGRQDRRYYVVCNNLAGFDCFAARMLSWQIRADAAVPCFPCCINLVAKLSTGYFANKMYLAEEISCRLQK